MASIDKEFSKICNEIFTNGKEYTNERRGVKRLQIPSYTCHTYPPIVNFYLLTIF